MLSLIIYLYQWYLQLFISTFWGQYLTNEKLTKYFLLKVKNVSLLCEIYFNLYSNKPPASRFAEYQHRILISTTDWSVHWPVEKIVQFKTHFIGSFSKWLTWLLWKRFDSVLLDLTSFTAQCAPPSVTEIIKRGIHCYSCTKGFVARIHYYVFQWVFVTEPTFSIMSGKRLVEHFVC